MSFQAGYPLDLQTFPDDDDILMTEADLTRKNVKFCRPEILHQMKCTQWAKEEYLALDKDPEIQAMWFHFHLQKCYTPYMDAMGCLVNLKDREVSKWKKEAGPEGWKLVEKKWIHDTARKVGENKAKMMWELSTNFKEIFEKTRQRDGHLYGEQPAPDTNSTASTALPRSMVEVMGMGDLPNFQTGPPRNSSHQRLETLMARAKQQQLQQQREREEALAKKSFWAFGGTSSSS